MKKLMLLIAAFTFVAATATFAQTADTKVGGQEPVKSTVSTEKPDAHKACCKAGGSKSCCKNSASAAKNCTHDHADASTTNEQTNANATPAAGEAKPAPAGAAPASSDSPKK
jgi:hypothetical protein